MNRDSWCSPNARFPHRVAADSFDADLLAEAAMQNPPGPRDERRETLATAWNIRIGWPVSGDRKTDEEEQESCKRAAQQLQKLLDGFETFEGRLRFLQIEQQCNKVVGEQGREHVMMIASLDRFGTAKPSRPQVIDRWSTPFLANAALDAIEYTRLGLASPKGSTTNSVHPLGLRAVVTRAA